MKRITCILALLYLAATHCTFGSPVITTSKSDSLRIVITFNNSSAESNLKAGPGFSAWIEFKGKVVVFDAGSDYLTLLENLQKLNLDFMKVTDIFISHNHWDHVYGLPGIAGVKNFQVNTFIPKSSVEAIRQQVPRIQYTAIDEFKELYPGIWSTGEMYSEFLNTTIAEQSLILETEDGLAVISGCSHAGIETLINRVNAKFPGKTIKLLLGGFHLEKKTPTEIENISGYLKKSGVKTIAPSHCTGDAAIGCFKNDWGDNFIQMFLGDERKQ
jgi:7,8-dihydropterin-6-yl-methyl-4-(beta-D-ribofuranosyl)aminobenzene 5'-phosphate synthase